MEEVKFAFATLRAEIAGLQIGMRHFEPASPWIFFGPFAAVSLAFGLDLPPWPEVSGAAGGGKILRVFSLVSPKSIRRKRARVICFCSITPKIQSITRSNDSTRAKSASGKSGRNCESNPCSSSWLNWMLGGGDTTLLQLDF